MKKLLGWLTVCFVPIAISCTSGNNSKNENGDAESDSTQTVIEKEVLEHLPDTVFSSVEKVNYIVDLVDSSINAKVDPLTDLYTSQPSIMTFRRGPKRQGNFNGTIDTFPTQIVVDWRFDTAHDSSKGNGRWGGGTGWTGQPLYIEWPDSLVNKLKTSGLVNDNFNGKEVISASLCGQVYFINPDNGKPTRNAINIVNPVKGTPSFDPTFNGNLYVGEGIAYERPFGALVINLFENKVSDFFPEDKKAYRRWGAYDSSPVRVGQFLIRPGENGTLYKFLIEPGKLTLQSALRYKVNGQAPGIESSIAIYANYGFITDNAGNVMAVNLDTMKPVWYYDLGDDTDASPMVVVEDGEPYVYFGCEIDNQVKGFANFVKLKALTGEEVWKIQVEGHNHDVDTRHFDGGFYSSPLLGQGDCEGWIFTNVVKNTKGQNGNFMAIDRKTGKVVYEIPLKYYSWSSPVGLLTNKNEMVVVTGDCAGNLYIINGKKGEIVTTERVGHNFESSPCLVGHSFFVGSRSNGIFKVTLK